jgi:hypothetical protein
VARVGRVIAPSRRPARPQRILLAVLAVVILGGVLGLRSPDPARADPAARHLVIQQVAADRAQALSTLTRLHDAIASALGEGRQGAALTVAGSDLPGPHLAACGRQLAAADRLVGDAQRSLGDLRAWLSVAVPGQPAPTLTLVPGELAATGGQLISAADAADAFAAMRGDTEATLASLRDAFAAIDAGDAAAALVATSAASASLARVQSWQGKLDTLPVWIDTIGALIDAIAAMARAIEQRDPAAAAAAEARYRQAASDALQADNALAIALAEGGSAVSSSALASAAQEQGAVEATLDQLMAMVPPADPA